MFVFIIICDIVKTIFKYCIDIYQQNSAYYYSTYIGYCRFSFNDIFLSIYFTVLSHYNMLWVVFTKIKCIFENPKKNSYKKYPRSDFIPRLS